MLITPRLGVNRDNLLKALQSVQGELSNLYSGSNNARNAQERALAYLKWTNSAVRMLGTQVSPSDLSHLVLTTGSASWCYVAECGDEYADA